MPPDASRAFTTRNSAYLSFHHNLITHASLAGPQLSDGDADIRANLFYDFDQGVSYSGPSPNRALDNVQSGYQMVLPFNGSGMPGYIWSKFNTLCTPPTTNSTIEMSGNYYLDRKWDGAGTSGNDNITQEHGDEANVAMPWPALAGFPAQYYINDTYHEKIGHMANPWDTYKQQWNKPGQEALSVSNHSHAASNESVWRHSSHQQISCVSLYALALYVYHMCIL